VGRARPAADAARPLSTGSVETSDGEQPPSWIPHPSATRPVPPSHATGHSAFSKSSVSDLYLSTRYEFYSQQQVFLIVENVLNILVAGSCLPMFIDRKIIDLKLAPFCQISRWCNSSFFQSIHEIEMRKVGRVMGCAVHVLGHRQHLSTTAPSITSTS
jgi:hypothetical protein